MDIHNLKKLKVQELKDLLQERQLSTIGKKEDLITRLLESDPNHVATTDPEVATTANPAEQTEILVKAGPDLEDPSVVAEGGKEQQSSSQEESIPSSGEIIATVKTDAEVQSDIELVKSRAKRFGLELEDATLKSLRAKRFKGSAAGGGAGGEKEVEGEMKNKQTFLVDEETLKKRQQKFGIVETTPSNNNKSETEEGKQRTGKNNHDKGRKGGGGKRQGVSPNKPMVILDEAELAKRKSRQERFATENRAETTHA